MDKSNSERETHDSINVESSQLPFIQSAPKEKGIRLFGIEFGSQSSIVAASCAEESESGDTIIGCKDAKEGNNGGESRQRFECHYCGRNFPTPQALGGHQNAHKRERQHAKRAQLQSNAAARVHDVYGLMNYQRLATVTSGLPINNYPSWNKNSPSATAAAAKRFYGSRGGPYYPAAAATPINRSPFAMWRISTVQNNVPSLGSRERSSLHSSPLFTGNEMMKGAAGAVGGGGSGGSHQTRFVYVAKTEDQVNLDLHL